MNPKSLDCTFHLIPLCFYSSSFIHENVTVRKWEYKLYSAIAWEMDIQWSVQFVVYVSKRKWILIESRFNVLWIEMILTFTWRTDEKKHCILQEFDRIERKIYTDVHGVVTRGISLTELVQT